MEGPPEDSEKEGDNCEEDEVSEGLEGPEAESRVRADTSPPRLLIKGDSVGCDDFFDDDLVSSRRPARNTIKI